MIRIDNKLLDELNNLILLNIIENNTTLNSYDFNTALFVLYYSVYVDKIIIYEELLTKIKYIFGEDNKETYNEYLKRFLYDKDLDDSYIELVEVRNSIKGYIRKYFKLSDFAIYSFNSVLDIDLYNIIYDEINKLDYVDRHKYLDGYSLALAQHTTLSHYINIKYLSNIFSKENIDYKYKHHETSIRVKDSRYRVEWDLICKYNNKEYGVEVECGTTSNKDMQRKIWKHNILVNNNKKYRDVIVACPNKDTLDKTRELIEKNIDDYWNNYKRKEMGYGFTFDVNYIYINLSTINSKNKIGNILKKKQLKTLY